jgi:uncharacterized protein (TIGR00730 family)
MRTGDDKLDRMIGELLDAALTDIDGHVHSDNRDQLRDILSTAVLMCGDRADRLDLKIANSALAEMRDAYNTFGPYRDRRKVTIFGSARTAPDSPLYAQTRDLAASLAAQGWMVITGAGPGIMAAGLEGAGRENALGAAIRLPFESEASEYVDPDRLVDMRYFFTRKLALIRESDGFVVMPGGFGTLDETFELLTLLQTGKAEPVPVVMLGLGSGYWHAWDRFVDTVVEQGYAGNTDRSLYRITNDVNEAVEQIVNFYANYHSIRWVGDTLIVRLQQLPTPARLAEINDNFASWSSSPIEPAEPSSGERGERDHLELARVKVKFDKRQPGRLRSLIDALNQAT